MYLWLIAVWHLQKPCWDYAGVLYVMFQLDVEMSFVTQGDIMQLIEALLSHCWPSHLEPLSLPLPRLSYTDAVRRYGSDKPDLRYNNLVTCCRVNVLCWLVYPEALNDFRHIKCYTIHIFSLCLVGWLWVTSWRQASWSCDTSTSSSVLIYVVDVV